MKKTRYLLLEFLPIMEKKRSQNYGRSGQWEGSLVLYYNIDERNADKR